MSGAERIEPFRALLYDPSRCGEMAAVVAPPYDLIDAQSQARLYARSPYNVVRLELGREPDPYAEAARSLRQWLEMGIVRRASTPAIYLYTQIFAVAGRRLRRDGLVVRIRLEEFSAGRILPHEKTFPAPKEDRLKLLTAVETNISPIFGLYLDGGRSIEEVSRRALSREPLLAFSDDLEIRNELRALEDAAEIGAVQRALADSRVLIADGHHRYETALEYCRRRRAAADARERRWQPYDYTMITLFAHDAPGLVILPTHRVVRRLRPEARAAFEAQAAKHFRVESFTERRALRERLKLGGRGKLGVALAGAERLFLLGLEDASALGRLMPELPAELRELDVSILHSLVLDRIFGLKPEEVRKGGNVEYTTDFDGAVDAVAQAKADGAFLMNPPPIGDVERVSTAGGTMPEKSTYFYPKLLTGLLMNPLSD